jgi:hypothetical protein
MTPNFEQTDFERKLALMTPRIMTQQKENRQTPFPSFGRLAAAFLLGVFITYFAMQTHFTDSPEKTVHYSGTYRSAEPVFLLDEKVLSEFRQPIDICRLKVYYVPAEKTGGTGSPQH